MIKLGIGKLACFDGSTANWKILNQADRYIHRGVQRMGGVESMCVVAHPRTAIPWGNTVEILLFKIAGGQARFAYSETHKVDFSEDGQIGVVFPPDPALGLWPVQDPVDGEEGHRGRRADYSQLT
jgi:hypothetical protein